MSLAYLINANMRWSIACNKRAAWERFSFLLATTIILAAGTLEAPKLLRLGSSVPLGLMLLCGALSGLCAYASTALLMRYFQRSEIESLRPFAAYCLLLGGLGLLSQLM
ncbi:undecaprenyl-diphosphate phosphatase [Chitinimonas sp.]|uniref:undecaprenyl-diphosphate phosphatase n=1 Tax=Chitinimonas sp. TaxID=1934313 RepID=UPI0035AD9963